MHVYNTKVNTLQKKKNVWGYWVGWGVKFEIIATGEEYIVCKVIQTQNALNIRNVLESSFMDRLNFFSKNYQNII